MKTPEIIHTLIHHESTPTCCGCWIIIIDSSGYWAECNECGKRHDIVELLREAK